MRPRTSGSLMKKAGWASATSGRNSTSSSHSSAPTVRPSWRKLCWLRIMSKELRATESTGFTRPPSSAGRRENPSTSKPRTLPVGMSAAAAPARATPPTSQGTSRESFMSRLLRDLAPPHGAAQGDAEVNQEPHRHQDARDVGQEPAGILHHLQHRQGVPLAEARLVEGLPVVAQRLVHVDEHVALLAARGVGEVHQAGEV